MALFFFVFSRLKYKDMIDTAPEMTPLEEDVLLGTTDNNDILLADDDSDDVVIFETALRDIDASYILRNAADGEQLFVLLKERVPYMLFLDINMPCKDGIACILEIRKHREYDNLPVVMYTSFFSDKFVDESYKGGANLFVTKTDTVKELTAKLKKIFSMDWKHYLNFPPKDHFLV